MDVTNQHTGLSPIKLIRLLFIVVLVFTALTSHSQYSFINHDGLNRGYLLHLPDGYDGNLELPLVLAMHGGFGSPDNIQNQSQLSVKADEENFIVVYPEGVKGGVLDIRTWNAGWCCGHASNTGVDDVGFIDALLDTLIAEYSIDTTRIYATGMSNGGFMSYRLACELSERIAAIAPVAASMSVTDCNPVRPVPVISFHSYLDSNVPYDGGVGDGFSSHYNPPQDSVLNAWASLNTCQSINDTIIDNEEYTEIHWGNCSCISEVHHFITQDGGHSWPGGRKTAIGDPVSEFINANDMMWEFFQQYTLECNQTSSTKGAHQDIPVKIFPNPAIDVIHIWTSSSGKNSQIMIYDIQGRELDRVNNATQLDVSKIPNGIYILKFIMDGLEYTGRFMKVN